MLRSWSRGNYFRVGGANQINVASLLDNLLGNLGLRPHRINGHNAVGERQLLLPLLHDREMPVRCAAIVALGIFADRQAFDPLVACLAAPISLERKNAVQALVALGDPRSRDTFLGALKTEMNPFVRAGLIKAVSVFPEEAVLETLIELLTDRDEDVRAVAAIALGKMGQPRAIPALQQMALTDTH